MWTAKLREETGGAFPEEVTAFQAGMAVHGRYRRPCPHCGAPVQRFVYAPQRRELPRGVPDRRPPARRLGLVAAAARELTEDAQQTERGGLQTRAIASPQESRSRIP